MKRAKLVSRAGTAAAAWWLFIATPAMAAPDLAITVTTPSVSAMQGTTAAFTVRLDPSGGFNGTVQVVVSNLPAGATSPTNYILNVSGSGTTYQHAINVGATTPVGSHTITFTTTGLVLSPQLRLW